MAFGLRNAPATFQRLTNQILVEVPNCAAYLEDVVVYSDTWDQHLELFKVKFTYLSDVPLVSNLNKCEFGKGVVSYFGNLVEQGIVKPLNAKMQVICAFPIPKTRRDLRHFLGMVGNYCCL